MLMGLTLMMAFVASVLSEGWCRISSSIAEPRLLAVSPVRKKLPLIFTRTPKQFFIEIQFSVFTTRFLRLHDHYPEYGNVKRTESMPGGSELRLRFMAGRYSGDKSTLKSHSNGLPETMTYERNEGAKGRNTVNLHQTLRTFNEGFETAVVEAERTEDVGQRRKHFPRGWHLKVAAQTSNTHIHVHSHINVSAASNAVITFFFLLRYFL